MEFVHRGKLRILDDVDDGRRDWWIGYGIGYCIQKVAEKNKLGIVRNLSGHGVGYKVHDYPSILNFGRPNQGELIKEGMALAIEPMFTLGGGEVKTAIDGWAVETVDRSYAAQFEHTILVSKSGAEIITVR